VCGRSAPKNEGLRKLSRCRVNQKEGGLRRGTASPARGLCGFRGNFLVMGPSRRGEEAVRQPNEKENKQIGTAY